MMNAQIDEKEWERAQLYDDLARLNEFQIWLLDRYSLDEVVPPWIANKITTILLMIDEIQEG